MTPHVQKQNVLKLKLANKTFLEYDIHNLGIHGSSISIAPI